MLQIEVRNVGYITISILGLVRSLVGFREHFAGNRIEIKDSRTSSIWELVYNY